MLPAWPISQAETRPELWGKYAYVLNKLQGIIKDARLEVVQPQPPPQTGAGTHGQSMATSSSSPHLGLPGGSSFMQLPGSALKLEAGHLAALRLDLMRQLQILEISVTDRKGPTGTAAGEVAFPKVRLLQCEVGLIVQEC